MLGACASLVALLGAAPAPSPAPSATPNPEAERLFSLARGAWRARTDVPYLRYGALVRYLHNGHVFDNWWDAYYRTRDGETSLTPIVDADEDRRRLRGVPFSIFGFTFFDTNRDAEPIRLDAPRIGPDDNFGVTGRGGGPLPFSAAAAPEPSPADAGGALREITRVEASARDYRIDLAGTETLQDAPAIHLKLTPLRDPAINRLRDLWLDPATKRTLQLRVQGILNGKPYDGIAWTVRYVVVDGRQYLQQIVADEPLRFGLDTVIPKFEFDFVDYHFPADVPKFTFDRPF
jgi:hypothetical protein